MRDSCGNSESKGDPTGVSGPRADRPRKASDLRSNQRPNSYKQKNVDELDFHRVCLHSESLFRLHPDHESDSVSKKPEFTWIPSTLPYKLFQCRTCLTYIAVPVF